VRRLCAPSGTLLLFVASLPGADTAAVRERPPGWSGMPLAPWGFEGWAAPEHAGTVLAPSALTPGRSARADQR